MTRVSQIFEIDSRRAGDSPWSRFGEAMFVLNVLAGVAAFWIFLSQESSAAFAMGIAMVGWLTACSYCRAVSGHGWFSVPLLYLVVLGVFHLPLALIVLMGGDVEVETAWINSPNLSKALCLCSFAFTFLTIGVAACRFQREELRHHATHRSRRIDRGQPILFQVGLFIWAIAFVMLAIGVRQLNLFSGGYGEYWERIQESDPRFFGTGLTLSLIAGILTASGASAKKIPLCAVIFITVLGPLAVFGFRGPFLVFLLAQLPMWHQKRPAFTRRFAAIGLLAVMVLAPTIKVARIADSSNWQEALTKVNPLSLFIETGGSLLPLVETVNLIEEGKTEYWMGSSYLHASRNVIPNLGSTIRRDLNTALEAPSHWLTYTVDPYTYQRGGGLGFSGVAEPYLNFGFLGVVVFFALLGWVMELANEAVTQKPFVAAWLLCALGALLWTTRNDFTNFTRPAAWSAAIVLVAYFVDVVIHPRHSRAVKR